MKSLSIKQRLALELYRKIKQEKRREHRLSQIFWECTWRCNLACRHCGSDCKSVASTPDMPADDFLKTIDSLLPHVNPHHVNIVITGGEPLLRKDLEYVGKELYKREFPWGIVSNGMLLSHDRLESLRSTGLHNLTISLDGLESTHNWMRNNPLSFRNAYSAICLAAKASDINFDVVTCVNRRSLPQLPEIKNLLIEAGVSRWRLFTIFPSGRAAEYPEFELTKDELDSLMQFISATRKEGRIRASFCCEGFMAGYEGEVRDYMFDCQAGVSVASILLDGSIGACPSIRADYTQGNIYDDDFWDVWQNRYQPYRDRGWMRTGACGDCSFWRYCEGNGMHLRDSEGKLMHCHLLK